VNVLLKTGNIFIHHDGALGDVLLSLPCIKVIRKSVSHIHIAGRTDVVHFLKEAGIADEVSSADSRRYSWLYTESLDAAMGSFLAGFDLSSVFTTNTQSRLVKNIRSVISNTRAILTIPPEASSEHAAAFRLEQCGFGADAEQRNITIPLSDNDKLWAAEFLREQGYAAAGQSLIIVHPGSGGKKKCWSPENYAALIRHFVTDPRILCIVVTGPAEEAMVVSSNLLYGKRVISLHKESLMRVAALLSLSAFYVGNDSGISHLAGIMGCRGAVLFGPTDPFLWRPQGNTLDVVSFIGSGREALSEIVSLYERHDIRSPWPKKTSGDAGE
jgi:heptosyltransferase III